MKTKLMALEALMKLPESNSIEDYGINFEIVEKYLRQSIEADIANGVEIEASEAKEWKSTIAGAPCPILYTDLINGQQVLRDDLWLATTSQLKADIAKPVEQVVWVSSHKLARRNEINREFHKTISSLRETNAQLLDSLQSITCEIDAVAYDLVANMYRSMLAAAPGGAG